MDDATYVTGPHTIKAGVYVRRIQENKASPNTPNQTISFTSLADFQNNLIDTDSYAGTVPVTGQRMTEYFGYIMDSWQIRPNLTWNRDCVMNTSAWIMRFWGAALWSTR